MSNYDNVWLMILAMIRRRVLPSRTQRIRDLSVRLGRRGEEAAAQYLADSGYEILSHNYLAPHGVGELDLVTRDLDGTLCIVEVKTRRVRHSALYPTDPRFAVDSSKRRRLLNATRAWLRDAHYQEPPSLRYDIIEVWARDGMPLRLRHWLAAFTHS